MIPRNNRPSHLLFNHYQNLERCAINKCTLALTDEVQRAALGEYPAYVHIAQRRVGKAAALRELCRYHRLVTFRMGLKMAAHQAGQ